MIQISKPIAYILDPVFNRVLIRMLSDNAGVDGFRYVLEIRNKITDQLITRGFYDTPYDPSEWVEVDVSRFMQGGFDYTNSIGYNVFEYSNCNLKQYKFVAKEYIDGAHNGQSATIENVNGWASSFSPYELPFITDNIFICNDINGLKRPLTDLRKYRIPNNGDALFSFIQLNNVPNLNTNKFLYVRVEQYNNGIFLGAVNITNNAVNPSNQYQVLHFRFNPSELISQGVDPTANRYILKFYYRINGVEYNSPLAEVTRMSCSRFYPVKVLWLNRYGVYDCYYFNMLNQDTYKVERKRYKREYTGQGYSDPWTSGLPQSGNRKIFSNTMPTYHTKEMHMIRVNSDYLTDAESIAMKQLFSSPSIYIVKENDDISYPNNDRTIIGNPVVYPLSTRERIIPVTLDQDTYEIKRNANQKLFNVEMTFNYCEHSNRQIT